MAWPALSLLSRAFRFPLSAFRPHTNHHPSPPSRDAAQRTFPRLQAVLKPRPARRSFSQLKTRIRHPSKPRFAFLLSPPFSLRFSTGPFVCLSLPSSQLFPSSDPPFTACNRQYLAASCFLRLDPTQSLNRLVSPLLAVRFPLPRLGVFLLLSKLDLAGVVVLTAASSHAANRPGWVSLLSRYSSKVRRLPFPLFQAERPTNALSHEQ